MKTTNCCGAPLLTILEGLSSNICSDCKEHADDEIESLKKDMLKMIDAIEKNKMHIKQLNWKINHHIKENKEEKVSNSITK